MNNTAGGAVFIVDRPASAQSEYGEQRVFKTAELGVATYHFEDNMVEVKWTSSHQEFSLVLTNRTNEPLDILWDDAEFVDEDGATSGVIHSGVLLQDYEKTQRPTTVAAGAQVTDKIIPKSKIYYQSGIYGSWRQAPLLPDSSDKAAAYVGKRLKLRLPLKVAGAVNDYLFVFEVNSVVVAQ